MYGIGFKKSFRVSSFEGYTQNDLNGWQKIE